MGQCDHSNGYEEIAPIYIAGRGQAHGGVGARVVAEWARGFAKGASVLDLGCGPGVPISETLIEAGLQVYGVDASERMVAAFRERFPACPVDCAPVADSNFFGRSFDGVVAWGLLFLLTEQEQRKLILKIARCLVSGGRLLFTAPSEACSWLDAMTERRSISLGLNRYREALEAGGLAFSGSDWDDGGNFHYFAERVRSQKHF